MPSSPPGAAAAKEVIEADLEQIRSRSIARNMAAQFAVSLVGAHDHGERIPPQRGGELFLDLQIARITRLLLERNRVLVRRVVGPCRFDTQRQRMPRELVEQKLRAITANMRDDRIERFQPFGGFLRIGIFRLRTFHALTIKDRNCSLPLDKSVIAPLPYPHVRLKIE